MVHGAAVDFWVILGGILIGALIGAVFLKTSCALYNMLADSSSMPSSPTAVGKPEIETKSELAPFLTPDDDRTDDESLAITKTPLRKRAPAADDDWAKYESIAALPSVPKPSFERAMGIVFVAALGNALAGFILLRILHLAGQPDGIRALVSMPIYLVYQPLNFLILSVTIKVMLHTSFGKGLLVALLFNLLIAAVSIVVFAAIVLRFGLSAFRFG
ncbi:MAG TPA: hypothetical protein VMF69_09030 [Gemmataceae bacterium]|nr:hypothetical protein [Gemmataceae bacterium]